MPPIKRLRGAAERVSTGLGDVPITARIADDIAEELRTTFVRLLRRPRSRASVSRFAVRFIPL